MKKKFKGVKHISGQLRKYFPGKFPTYKSALSESRLVLAQIQDAGERVNNKNIFSKVRKTRVGKSPAPDLGAFLLDQNHYYMLTEYVIEIKKLPNTITFNSKLIPSGLPPIVGGGNINYDEYFKPYVDYINKQVGLIPEGEDSGSDRSDYFLKCTQPREDKKNKGRWISDILSVDSNGDEFDYGFDPKNPEVQPFEVVSSESESSESKPSEKEDAAEVKQPVAGGVSDDQEFLLRLEAQKEKTITASANLAEQKRLLIESMSKAGAPWSAIQSELNKL